MQPQPQLDGLFLGLRLLPWTSAQAMDLLERVVWSGKPTCPHCRGGEARPTPERHQHLCVACGLEFDVLHGSDVGAPTGFSASEWVRATVLVAMLERPSATDLMETMCMEWRRADRLLRFVAAAIDTHDLCVQALAETVQASMSCSSNTGRLTST